LRKITRTSGPCGTILKKDVMYHRVSRKEKDGKAKNTKGTIAEN
jgi:hypothetical protein